jgi:hypothetical protein
MKMTYDTKCSRKKYHNGKTLSRVEGKKEDSHFWSGLMKVKKLVLLERGVGLKYKMSPRLDSRRIFG